MPVAGKGGTPPRPVNAPDGYAASGGIQPGQSQGIISARRIVVFGPGDSVLIYSGTPAFGNLTGSDSPAGGTDAEGNVYLPGRVGYSTSGGVYFATQIGDTGSPNSIILYTAGSPGGPWTARTDIRTDTSGDLILAAIGGIINLAAVSGVGVSAGPFTSTAGTPASPSELSTDTWHSMSAAGFLNGWANTAGNVVAQYRLIASPPNSVEIIGAILASGATATTFFQLPAGYRPVSQQSIPAGATGGQVAGSTPFVQCDTSGNLSLQHGTIGAVDTYLFHGTISLDA